MALGESLWGVSHLWPARDPLHWKIEGELFELAVMPHTFWGFKWGGFPIWTRPSRFVPFLSCLGLSRFSRNFPDSFPGFPDWSFSSFSAYQGPYKQHSRRVPQHNQDPSQTSGKHPGLETPRFSFSQSHRRQGDLAFSNGSPGIGTSSRTLCEPWLLVLSVLVFASASSPTISSAQVHVSHAASAPLVGTLPADPV